MKFRIAIAIAGASLFLAGCASPPQQPIELAGEALATGAGRLGIAMTKLPKVDTHLPGASCLLCIAVAAAANSSLTAHAQTLPVEELPQLKNEVADLLRKKGADVTVIAEDLNFETLPDSASKQPNAPPKDFSSLRQKYQMGKLLVIDITMLGVIRTDSAYVPTSDPKGVLQGRGFIVNLTNNTYEWYLPVSITKSTDGKWDEPPKFPGLTNAYFQSLELGRDSFLKPFNK